MERRSFMKASLAGVAAVAAGFKAASVQAGDAASPYGPFKMGLQSYTLRHWKSLDDVLEKSKALGISYLEFYNAHLAPSADEKVIADYKKKLDDAKITAAAMGVWGFSEDVKANRKLFEFAHAMGIYTISADFKPQALVSLDKLCEEFPDVHIGIHNHGPKSSYQTPEDVLNCVKDHHKNIGATADLGHYIRSKQDPLEVIEKLKDRLYGVHFKDFKFNDKGGDQETIVGDGNLKIKEALSLLKKYNFQGCLSLEYESSESNPVPDLQKALERIRDAVKEI